MVTHRQTDIIFDLCSPQVHMRQAGVHLENFFLFFGGGGGVLGGKSNVLQIRRGNRLLYSGKLSREKTFADL